MRRSIRIQPFQLLGGPSWIGNDRFDMVAKIEGNPPPTLPGVTPDALMLAMRTLLADRFKLKLHHEQREMDIYALDAALDFHRARDATPDSGLGVLGNLPSLP